MCVTPEYLGSMGSTIRKSVFTGSTFLHLAFNNIARKVENRLRSLSKAKSYDSLIEYECGVPPRAHTVPVLHISVLRCDVLLPGAEVASITAPLGETGGSRTTAGKHDALSCKITFPFLYASSSWKDIPGWNRNRAEMCLSFAKICLVVLSREVRRILGNEAVVSRCNLKHILQRKAFRYEILNGLFNRPQRCINANVSRDQG